MRPLRDLIARAVPPREHGPVEPVALLSAVVRDAPEFDPQVVFDRALFGLSADDVSTLGPVLPHVCEVCYEALERSGIGFDHLRTLRVGTWLGVSDPQWLTVRDAPFVAELFGLPGPAVTVLESGAGLLLAVHQAVTAIRAGDTDLALVAGDHLEGVGALVLAAVDRVPPTVRVRALILGSAVNRTDEEVAARTIAAARAGTDEKGMLTAAGPGVAGIVEAVDAIERGETGVLTATEVGETTTAQIVLGVAEEGPPAHSPPRILALSARTRPALRELVRATLDRIRTEADLYGVANDALSRPCLEHRVATPLWSLDEVRERLEGFLRGEPGRIAAGYAVGAPIAFVVPPAGAQYVGMGDFLYGSEPVFREALNRCDRALRSVLPRPLLSVMYPAKGREVSVDDPVFANPLTFAFAFALAELYRSRGLVPDAVLGCGTGELAAAAIAGAVDVEEAVRVSAERGRLLESLTVEASRAVLGTSERVARELFEGDAEVDIVALPMPDRVVVGGSVRAVAGVVERARARGLRSEPMTGHPNNTPLVEPILAEFAAAAAGLQFQTPEVGWVSAATGRRTEHADAAHWSATLRAPMRFSHGVETLYALGCRSFVELAPRPTLLPAGERTLADQPSWWFAALDPDLSRPEVRATDDRRHHEELLAALWVVGASGIDRGPSGRFPGAAELPTYPWDRRPLEEEEETRIVAELSRVGEGSAEVGWVPELTEDALAAPVPLPVPAGRAPTADEPRDLLDFPGDRAASDVPPPGSGQDAPPAEVSGADAPPAAPLEAVPIEAVPIEAVPIEAAANEPNVPVPLRATAAESAPEVPPAPAAPPSGDAGSIPVDPQSERVAAVNRVPEVLPIEVALPSAAGGSGGIVPPPLAERAIDAMARIDGPAPVPMVPAPSVPVPAPYDVGRGGQDVDLSFDALDAELPTSSADASEAAAYVEELEDIEVDAYDARAPRTLAEAERASDTAVVWRESWVRDDLPESPAPSEATTWVILADAGGVGDYLATLLEGVGHKIVRVLQETPYPREDRTMFLPDPTVEGGWEPVVEALGTLHGGVRILHLWALDATDEELDPRAGWAGVLSLVRELRAQGLPARVLLVTRGVVSGAARDGTVRPPDPAAAATGGSLWGVAAALAVEAPYLFGGIVDLDPDDEDPDALLRHLLGGGTDARPVLASMPRLRSEHAFRGGVRYRRVIERGGLPAEVTVPTDGVWIVAGDLDVTAFELAEALVGRGVRRVYLVSPVAPPPEVLRGVLELQRRGVTCVVMRADPTESRDIVQIKSRLAREPRVAGAIVRVASRSVALVDLVGEGVEERMAAWTRALAMVVAVGQVAREAHRWVWAEGRGLDGVSGGGLAAITGTAAGARVLADPSGVRAVIHSGPASELLPGQAVRLVVQLGAAGGTWGIWR